MNFKKIFDAFPPPEFLAIPFAGVSISDSAIRVIKFGEKNKFRFIEKFSERVLPPGSISGGQINDTEGVKKILFELKDAMKLEYVKVSLPEEKGYLFTAKIPLVADSEVKAAIENKMEENVPVPPGELIFDYNIKENIEKERLDIVVSSLPIAVVDTYVEIIEGSGLKMLSLQIESQAITNALVSTKKDDTVLIVNFDKGKVGLIVVVKRIVHFTSTVQFKGSGVDSLDQLSQEIKRLFGYWHSLKENVGREDRKISEIILSGDGVEESTVSFLSSNEHMRVSLGNVWINAFDLDRIVPEISFNNSLKYVAAVGLALPENNLI